MLLVDEQPTRERAETDQEVSPMASRLDAIREQVRAHPEVTGAVVLLLERLKERLEQAVASGQMNEVQEVAHELQNDAPSIAEAVVANTSADTAGGAQGGPRLVEGGRTGGSSEPPSRGGETSRPGETHQQDRR